MINQIPTPAILDRFALYELEAASNHADRTKLTGLFKAGKFFCFEEERKSISEVAPKIFNKIKDFEIWLHNDDDILNGAFYFQDDLEANPRFGEVSDDDIIICVISEYKNLTLVTTPGGGSSAQSREEIANECGCKVYLLSS